jgi:hypothetical protein
MCPLGMLSYSYVLVIVNEISLIILLFLNLIFINIANFSKFFHQTVSRI